MAFDTKTSKSGAQFGIMKMEDFSGSYELMLFGKNYINFKQFGEVGTPILVRGTYTRSKYKDRIDFNIASIDLLADNKGRMVRDITITLPVETVTPSSIELLQSFVSKSAENPAKLYFNLVDTATGFHAKLISKLKLPVTRKLVDFLNEQELRFEVNTA